ncbi:tetratricopeptide repeat protein [Nocardioides sp. GY 10127]|uniref:tetratricopeptide repeat protein n=1 Tax=Nocardioides sp. GY 10127 TaxID=2569762 RepID=UPI0010A89850|nr:tetratricopeptide repeat protein [Nocardioides sp. GY 10127]TIC81903.1 tetratricopeptide repeat protein [Nocardioides sp. GY 10127]
MRDVSDLWDFSDPAGSLARLRAAAEAAMDSPGGADERRLLRTQVARALGLLERFEEGHTVLDGLVDGVHHDLPSELGVRMALERGRLRRSAGEDAPALALFTEAAGLARAAGLEELEIDALHMVCLVLPVDEQVAAHEAAIARAAACGSPAARAWDASLLNNLGMVHADAGDHRAALGCFERALAARVRLGDDDRTRVARWMVGWSLRLLGRDAEARAVQEALRAELDALGLDDPYVDEELALLRS